MDNYTPGKKWLLVLLIINLILGCTTTSNNKKVIENKTIADGSRPLYTEIIENAETIDKNYQTLQTLTAQFFEKYKASNGAQQKQHMTVATIAAGAHFLAQNMPEAEKYAKQAFSYLGDNSIEFISEWDTELWIESLPAATTKQLVQMKDFIISQNNDGLESFIDGNREFLGQAQYAKAIVNYEIALKRGLSKPESRQNCYIHLAGCLFKKGEQEKAEKVFLQGWLVFPTSQVTIGDGETKDFLNNLARQYQQRF